MKESWAFPVLDMNGDGHPGMTLRDYFAGQALAGMAHYITIDTDVTGVVESAYRYADTMLVYRKEGEGNNVAVMG